MIMRGSGVSCGIAIGRICLYRKARLDIPNGPGAGSALELALFERARADAIASLTQLSQKMRGENAPDLADIFEAHQEILRDDVGFVEPVHSAVIGGQNAAAAVDGVLYNIAETFRALESVYMRERAADIEDLRASIVARILGVPAPGVTYEGGDCLIAAYDLAPSDTAKLDLRRVAGLITQIGGATGHTAIMARTLGIPAIVGVPGLMDAVEQGQEAVADGCDGTLILSPNKNELAEYRAKQAELARRQEELQRFASAPTVTADGRSLRLEANIGTPEDAVPAVGQGAEGFGLVRTEFLFMQREDLPPEEEQYAAYRRILEAAGDRPVTFRTLDAGGDKELPALNLPPEDNPFLGLRAIRICLKQPELFKAQLRALLRAARHGNARIMLPMVSSVTQVRQAKAILEEAKAELRAEGVPFHESVPLGIMVEIPAAAIQARDLARAVDFFSLGTNDLIQYTLAADRGNPAVADISTFCHPAVLRLVHGTIAAAEAAGIPCGLCGEAAGDPLYIPFLLGAGLEEYSMSASRILAARKLLLGLSHAACRDFAARALELDTPEQVSALFREFHEKGPLL